MQFGQIKIGAIALIAVSALVLGACGSDKKDATSSSTTTPASDTTVTASGSNAQTVAFDKSVQADLAKVGCYTGNVDGIIGPETDAAIVAFQKAEGLETDGELGPETDSALTAAVSANKTVCAATTGTTVAPTTTTTTANSTPPCTATAVGKVLGSGETVTSYLCSEGYAAVVWTTQSGSSDAAVLIANGANWKIEEPTPCGAASAGIPAQVLEMGCPA